MSKQSKICKKALALLEHTRERLTDHPKRQAYGRCHSRYVGESHRGLRDFYRKYGQRRANADGKGGVKTKGNIIPKT